MLAGGPQDSLPQITSCWLNADGTLDPEALLDALDIWPGFRKKPAGWSFSIAEAVCLGFWKERQIEVVITPAGQQIWVIRA
jgi:hypothetical protein